MKLRADGIGVLFVQQVLDDYGYFLGNERLAFLLECNWAQKANYFQSLDDLFFCCIFSQIPFNEFNGKLAELASGLGIGLVRQLEEGGKAEENGNDELHDAWLVRVPWSASSNETLAGYVLFSSDMSNESLISKYIGSGEDQTDFENLLLY